MVKDAVEQRPEEERIYALIDQVASKIKENGGGPQNRFKKEGRDWVVILEGEVGGQPESLGLDYECHWRRGRDSNVFEGLDRPTIPNLLVATAELTDIDFQIIRPSNLFDIGSNWLARLSRAQHIASNRQRLMGELTSALETTLEGLQVKPQ